MTEFEKKLPLYKTAFSPIHETFVGIQKVRQDDSSRFIVEATVSGMPKDQIHLFRPEELTDYCL